MKVKILFLLLVIFTFKSIACTIVTGVDAKGQTWVMNNEDFFHTYSNYVNVYPSQKNTLGYITLTYGSPESGIQGGANEAGVFFDINALPPQAYKLSEGKKPFTSGSMLLYLLQHCKTVPEFLKLWEAYYMPGMNDIQIHLADKKGNLAIITPDTIVSSKTHLTSTNFNVCESGPNKQACWRYPIAERVIAESGVSKGNLVKIANATSWREFTTTVYTNIHNLSTGEIWFYLAEDYSMPWYTNINALLKKGKQSILLATKFPKNAGLKLNKVLENGGNTIEIRELLLKGKFDDIQKESTRYLKPQ
jgi:penicillin V acylase-like amidase (Ntn superfamily)